MSRIIRFAVSQIVPLVIAIIARRHLCCQPLAVSCRVLGVMILAGTILPLAEVKAFSYLPPPFEAGPGIVVHPAGYTGQGGVLDVSIGIDPTSAYAVEMVPALNNAIATWNELTAVNNNVLLGGASDVPAGTYDFESVLLHEIGHGLGLSHPNLAPESGVDKVGLNFTAARAGENGLFELGLGADGIEGSYDDLRGDDVNMNYFPIRSNNPFDDLAVIDSTTYSYDLADLPDGHLFAANPDRNVAGSLGLSASPTLSNEAVMQQGAFAGESQRQLSYDDVAGIRYAASGLDEIQGTADDYTLNLLFVGFTSNADIVVDFDNSFDYAGMSFSTYRVNALHRRMYSATIMFNDTINWHFGESATCVEGDINCDGRVSLLDLEIIGTYYGQNPATREQGDLNGDNIVGLPDLDIMGRAFGNSVVQIPEPASLGMVLLGTLAVSRRLGVVR